MPLRPTLPPASKRVLAAALLVLGALLAGCTADAPGGATVAGSGKAPEFKNLMKTRLEGVKGTEVVVSHVTIPPNTTLPKHWHPGEEFAYVLEGSATLWQKGKPEVLVKKGEVVKVPLKQIHTAKTGREGVTLVVFRVHEEGQPERVPAE